MRVLLISHNVFSITNNMGKTLLSYFADFTPDEIAEFYIQEKEPKNAEACHSYYRVTDRDALKSVFGKRIGERYYLKQSQVEASTENTGVVESIRQYGRKRNALVYTMRNTVWALAHWKSKEFLSWIQEFDPEVIFFMAGDYTFMFNITYEIQELIHKPLVVCCVDDYFLFNRNENTVLGRLQYRLYMRSVHKLMERAGCILTISDAMGEAYKKLFNKPCFTLHTSAKRRVNYDNGEKNGVSYFGNLGFQRYKQLVEMGKAIKSLDIKGINGIDVYSAEKNPENLVGLTEENGIHFHGEIDADELAERMNKCMAIIHTESFDPQIINMIKYSVSTKIADSLMNGPCLIAYGPDELASIDYLRKNEAAYVITEKEKLEDGLREILTNEKLRAETVKHARALASQNHDEAVNPKKVREWLQMAMEGCP